MATRAKASEEPEGPVEDDWTTWTDAELMTRLLRRGCDPVEAKGLVRDRALGGPAVEEIEAYLAVEILDQNERPVRLEVPLDRRRAR